jgi:uncharacterized short protein YbdD (DUF466 family)
MLDDTARRPARTSSVRAGAPAALGILKRGCRGISWYIHNLMGDNAYQNYLEHHRSHHGPQLAPLSERQFWRQRMDDQDRNPGARCC